MSNFTRSDLEWRAVMTSWLESNTDLDVSTVFSDDEYGLLNAAKFFNASQAWMLNNDRSEDDYELFSDSAVLGANNKSLSYLNYFVNNSLVNFSHTDIISRSPSNYGLPEISILSVIVTGVMVLIVIGTVIADRRGCKPPPFHHLLDCGHHSFCLRVRHLVLQVIKYIDFWHYPVVNSEGHRREAEAPIALRFHRKLYY